MNKDTEIKLAKSIMKENMIGFDDLKSIQSISFFAENENEDIPFDENELKEKKDDYLLIYGYDKFDDYKPITIRNLISVYGKNPDVCEPCFYNQDWYEKEDFIDVPMKKGWFLIRKNVFENSRAKQPDILRKTHVFPSAIACTYAFFVAWLIRNERLWYHDFVWCSDTDHNGDRIYVGKYHDIDGINKNGFSIHRHLGLRECYGCID